MYEKVSWIIMLISWLAVCEITYNIGLFFMCTVQTYIFFLGKWWDWPLQMYIWSGKIVIWSGKSWGILTWPKVVTLWYHMTQKIMLNPILSLPKEFHGIIDYVVCIMQCNADANGIIWPKSHIAPHFDSLDLGNAMVPLMVDDASASANGVTWSKNHLHFILVILT